MAEMINEPLHLLFHDLSNPIGGIDTMSQICVSYVTRFNLEKLGGEFKENITTAFRNISSYNDAIVAKLRFVVNALTEISNSDIGIALQDCVNKGLNDIKEIEESAERLYNQLLESDTKENLLKFCEEVKKFQPVCNSMVKSVNCCKDKLTTLGKY